MKTIERYSRGQIWMWEDPIFGSNKSQTPTGEGNQRFNRPVLIISNSELVDKSRAVVLPISSKNKTVTIPIHLPDTKMTSFLIMTEPMTIKVHQLTEYIGTMSDDVMLECEHALLTALFHHDCLDQLNMVPYENLEHTLSVEDYLMSTKCSSLSGTNKPDLMFKWYQDYCNERNLASTINTVEEFVEEANQYIAAYMKGRKPIELKTKIEKPELDVHEVKYRKKRAKTGGKVSPIASCDDKTKEEFLVDYENMTIKQIKEKYQISTSSVSRYHKKIAMEFANQLTFRKSKCDTPSVKTQPDEVVYIEEDISSYRNKLIHLIDTRDLHNTHQICSCYINIGNKKMKYKDFESVVRRELKRVVNSKYEDKLSSKVYKEILIQCANGVSEEIGRILKFKSPGTSYVVEWFVSCINQL